MTTTVRLLSTYDGFVPQSIIDLPDSDAANLTGQGAASTDLTGGTRAYRDIIPQSNGVISAPVGVRTVRQNRRLTLSVPEGFAPQMVGASGAVGAIQQVDASGNAIGTATVLGTGAGPSLGSVSGGARYVLTCATGSIDVTVVNAATGAARFSSDGLKLVNASGQNLLAVGKYKYILPIGTSITELNRNCGRSFSGNVNITGLIFQGASLNWPDGAATLRFDKATGTLSVQANGDTVGPAQVVAKGGVFTLTSGNPAYTFRVGVKQTYLPATSQNDTLTPGASQWTRGVGGWLYVFQALTSNRFSILPLLGISGDQVQFMGLPGGRYDQAIAIAAARGDTVISDEGGTNDIHLSPPRTATEIANFRIAFWDKCGAAGIPVLAQLISPRWGRDAAGTPLTDNGFYTAANQGTLVTANRLLRTAAKTRPHVFIIDNYSRTTDVTQVQGRAKDGWTDGIHPLGAMSMYGYAPDMIRSMNILSPGDGVIPNVGAGSYYHATNNPSGNLLQSNTGALAGAGGTPLTGVTVGTGLAANMQAGHAGPAGGLTAVANKVAADDRGGDWQEFVMSGCTVLNEQIGMYFPTISTNFAAGVDTIMAGIEWRVVGSGCYGIFIKINVGGVAYAIQANQLQSVASGLDNQQGYLSIEDYPIPAGVTSFDTQVYCASTVGASFKIQYRSANFSKVL